MTAWGTRRAPNDRRTIAQEKPHGGYCEDVSQDAEEGLEEGRKEDGSDGQQSPLTFGSAVVVSRRHSFQPNGDAIRRKYEVLNAIEEKLTEIRATAMEQSNRIANDLNAAADAMNGALTRFNMAMTTVRQKRQEADQLEAAAIRELDTAIANNQTIQIGIVQQIADGRMVTGSDTPVIPTRKPKLVRQQAVGGDA